MTGIIINIENRDLAASTQTDANGLLQGIKLGDNRADIIERVMSASKCEFKHRPTVGMNLRTSIGGNPDKFQSANIIQQLKLAGISVNTASVVDGEIYIDYD